MTLYEITGMYETLLQMAEDPDVDPEVLKDTMEGIEGEFDDKADGYAKVIAQLKAEAEVIKKEADRLTARKRALEANAERIKATLEAAMIAADRRKFKTALFSFGIQKNPPKVVMDTDDIMAIPPEYIILPEPVADLTAIKDALKQGIELEGIAHLEQGESLRIR